MGVSWWDIGFEAVKLSLQFAGALYIAWRAVRWALSRYKSEKHWERRLAAYTDLLSAMGTLMQILDVWEARENTGEKEPELESVESRARRYWEARRKLAEARSVTLLLLPDAVNDALSELIRGLHDSRSNAEDLFDVIAHEYSSLLRVHKDIVQIAKKDLGL
jgi:hypothetical protein